MRVAKTTDLELISSLDSEIWAGDWLLTKEELTEWQWWILWDEVTPIGFAGLKIGAEGSYSYGYLSRSGILRSYRGKGLQQRLIAARERAARKAGVAMMITYTHRHHYASANNLAAQGYKLYYPEYVYGLKDGLYFRKQLRKGKT